MKAVESSGILIEGGWLVFGLLLLGWLILMIQRRVEEENRTIRELENQRESIESLISLNHSLGNAQLEQAEHASSQVDKTDQTETPSINRAGDEAESGVRP